MRSFRQPNQELPCLSRASIGVILAALDSYGWAQKYSNTLLEVMVVVGIVGILAALAIPAISTYSEPQSREQHFGDCRCVCVGRAQAKRLNRAVLVDVSGFDKQRPKGLSSCTRALGATVL